MSDYEDQPAVIIDTGACTTKVGFGGEDRPQCIFPTTIGRLRMPETEEEKQKFVIGTKAIEERENLYLTSPIENGIINNWDDMEKIWNYCFEKELKCSPKEHRLMLTEAALNEKETGEKMAQIMYEKFEVPALHIGNQAALSLYCYGKFTGIVCDSGDGVTQFVPIFDGYPIPNAVELMDFAGKTLTQNLMKYFRKLGVSFSDAEFEVTKNIKEKFCCVALDYNEELKTIEEKNYELPDGRKIKIKEQRITCPEALFKPEMIGKELGGFHKRCFDSIQKCEIDLRKDLYQCIVLSGGCTMFKGMVERLTKEMKILVPQAMETNLKILAVPERKYAVWNGGSILSSIPTFDNMWCTRAEYDEVGPSIVYTKKMDK